MSVVAIGLVAAIGGAAIGWPLAYGRGWKAADRLWEAEWDDRLNLDRVTWVDAAELGAEPAATTEYVGDAAGHGDDRSDQVVPAWYDHADATDRPRQRSPLAGALTRIAGALRRIRAVPAEGLIVRLHAERGEVWVRRAGGAHREAPLPSRG